MGIERERIDEVIKLEKEPGAKGAKVATQLTALKQQSKQKTQPLQTQTKDDYIDNLEEYGKEILSEMEANGVPATPNNYQLYFEKLFDDKPQEFRKAILQILEGEDTNEAEKLVNLEKKIKEAFLNIKQILQIVAAIYKNMNLMGEIATKRSKEITNINNPMMLQNVVTALNGDIEKLNSIVRKQTNSLKELYHQSATIVQEVETDTIYDSLYGVYNKRYLMSQAEKEYKSVEQFGHQSTIVMAKLSSSISEKIKSEKALTLISRTISRLLIKTSRRSDIVGHYGEGVFGLLLKHSDLFSAKKASERLSDMVGSTNFFLGDSEINLDISIGIAKIEPIRAIDDTINCALNAMKKNDNQSDLKFVVCSMDEEEK